MTDQIVFEWLSHTFFGLITIFILVFNSRTANGAKFKHALVCIGNKKSSHGTSLNLETETEIKVEENSRLETETETLEMPETRPRRDSRLISVREMVETESLADPWCD